MPILQRRDVLAGGAALAAVGPSASAFANARRTALAVYTDDFPLARDLALKDANGLAAPLKGDLVRAWSAKLSKHRGAIIGYTNWSDYVLLRGLAEERGLRLPAETQMRGPAGKTLFRWIMA